LGGDYSEIKSYEILHDDFINFALHSKLLRPFDYYEWKYHDPVTDKYYSRKATLVEKAGKIVRLEIAIDITSEEVENKIIRQMNDIIQLSNTAIMGALSIENPDESLKYILSYAGEKLGCHRTYLFEKKDNHYVSNTYEWCAPGISSMKERCQYQDLMEFKEVNEELNAHHNVLVRDVNKLRLTEPAFYNHLLARDVQTIIISPLFLEGKMIGFFGFDNPPTTEMENISIMTKLLGAFLSALLRHRNNAIILQRMSHRDQLTGAYNRHAFEEYLDGLENVKGFGLSFCDMNGMKLINDNEGHEAGDQALIRLVEILRIELEDEEIYRIGGDEFILCLTCLTEKEFEEKIKELQKILQKNNVSVSMGSVWRPAKPSSCRQILKEADSRMYKAKQAAHETRADLSLLKM